MSRLVAGPWGDRARPLGYHEAKRARFALGTWEDLKKYLRAKEVFPFDVYDALTDAERQRAFSTALRFELDLLEKLHEDHQATLIAGGTARDFWTAAEKTLRSFGFDKGDVPAHRLELIFHQESRRAWDAGRYSAMFDRDGMQFADGWLYVARRETVAKDKDHICSRMNGLRFLKTDVAARRFLPPLHFRCACVAQSVQIQAGEKITNGLSLQQGGVAGDTGFDYDKLQGLESIFGPLGRATAA